MSTIHSSCALLGCRSALRCGTARCSTVRSIDASRVGSASTASPAHSRRPALGGYRCVLAVVWDRRLRLVGLSHVSPRARGCVRLERPLEARRETPANRSRCGPLLVARVAGVEHGQQRPADRAPRTSR